MENIQKPKLGAGIKTLCILTLIGSVFGIVGSIRNMLKLDETNELLKSVGFPETTIPALVIGIVLTVILALGIILILMKKELGVYIYFTASVASIVYSIVSNGFKLMMLTSLIMPVLMAIFIWKKKEIFGLGAEAKEASL